MNVRLLPYPLQGSVAAIPSKSYAHRILLCAALADASCRIECPSVSEDIAATLRCIAASGAGVRKEHGVYSVNPVKYAEPRTDTAVLDCGESGTTLRFMLPAVCAAGVKAVLTGKGRLPERPIGGLAGCLTSAGIGLSSDRLPIEVSGILTAGEYEIPADVSSQYVSGMLIALSALNAPSRLKLKGHAVSSGYIDMTLDVLKKFGAEIVREDYGYTIEGGGLHSPGDISVEGDWSNAAFWLAAGALNGDVSVTGLNPVSAQRDSQIAEILSEMGADICSYAEAHGKSVRGAIPLRTFRAVKSRLHAVSVDVTDIPDLAPILSVLMAAADGVSEMRGTGRLRAKESDRLHAVIRNLAAMGVGTETDAENNSVKIHGGKIEPFRAAGFNDHRMVMSACVAGTAVGGEVTDAEAVAKSYPAFYRDLEKLGGKYENF